MSSDLTVEVVDIRPESDILRTYRRLSYQPWYAVAEFVDNSTWNYDQHRQRLAGTGMTSLEVDIFYDRDRGKLSVTDNAHGMSLEEFKRALQLGRPPANTSGRSEFGMGLKTAACWLGPRWVLRSTQLGSSQEYTAVVDIGELVENKPSSLQISVRNDVDPAHHYTHLEIEGLQEYGRVFAGRTIGKIKQEIASIYRRDLQHGDVVIKFGGDPLSWASPDLLIERVGDESIVWRRDVNFEVHGKAVSGWIGLLAKGKAAEAGFHLFRRGRIIQGGQSQGWKPWDIFGAPNSFQSQRLTGELDFDEWPVSHTKDRLDWSGPDEEILLETLGEITADYIAKARESRKSDGSPGLSKAAAESALEETKEELEESDELGATIAILEEGILPESDPLETQHVQEILEDLGDDFEIHFGGTSFPAMKLGLSDESTTSEPLVRVGFPADDLVTMVLNLKHPFVSQFVGDNQAALKLLAHMLYVDALVERIARRSPDLSPAQLRRVKDDLLRNLRSSDSR